MQLYDSTQVKLCAEALAHHLREIVQQRNMAEDELKDLQRENDDIIHRMEHDDCLYDERARLATRLAAVRKQRRKLKDWMCANQRYFDYMGSDNGKKIQNMLDNLVSVGRKVEAAPGRHKKS